MDFKFQSQWIKLFQVWTSKYIWVWETLVNVSHLFLTFKDQTINQLIEWTMKIIFYCSPEKTLTFLSLHPCSSWLHPSFSSTVFIPSCHCWQPPAGSVSSRGPPIARVTRPPTAREAKLWCHRKRPDKTTPWVCGGPGHSAPPQRGARSRAQLLRRPEALLVQPADINWVTPAMWYLFWECFGVAKVNYGSVRFSFPSATWSPEVEKHFWIIFEHPVNLNINNPNNIFFLTYHLQVYSLYRP